MNDTVTATVLKLDLRITNKKERTLTLKDPIAAGSGLANKINTFVDLVVDNEAILSDGLPVLGINRAYIQTTTTTDIELS